MATERGRRDFSVDDLYRFVLVRDLQLSPDGGEIVFERKSVDRDEDTYRSALWLLDTATGRARPLTQGASVEGAPRWSPDGRRIAFLSNRRGPQQAWIIDRGGGEARPIGHPGRSVSSIAWSHDGAQLLLGASVEVESRPEGWSQDRWDSRPRRIARQRYKSDGSGLLVGSESRLFVVDAATLEPEAELGEAGCDFTGASWVGDRIAYCRSRPGPREGHLSDVWIAARDGRGRERLSHDVPNASGTAGSPDGRWVAFKGTPEPGDSMLRLWLADVKRREVRPLGREYTQVGSDPLSRAGAPVWAPDSRSVAFLYARRGLTEAATVSVADGAVRRVVTGPEQLTLLHGNGERLAFFGHGAAGGGEIGIALWNGRRRRVLHGPNDPWWQRRRRPRVERRRFEPPGAPPIEGWVWLPPGRARGPVPLLVDVHGGPHSQVEFGFPYHVYWFALLARGWAVLALNAQGSGSYGPDFAHALRGRWGALDLPQHLHAVAELQREGLASDELAIAGKSYGGFMAAWAIGHTRVFRAAVASACIVDMPSHAGTSDSGYYVDPWDVKGELHERAETLHRMSPMHALPQARTPTLVLQGEDDDRCPVGQAEELFSRLMRLGRAPVELMLFPGGHHDLAEDGRPTHREAYHQAIVDWCERHARRGGGRRG